MKTLLIATALAGAVMASQVRAQAAPSGALPSQTGGFVAPTINAPPAFNGGQVTGVPTVQPFAQPNVGDPGFNRFPATTSRRRG